MTTIAFCNEDRIELLIEENGIKKRRRKAKKGNTESDARIGETSKPKFHVDVRVMLRNALEVMQKNEMLCEMFANVIGRLSKINFESIPELSFLDEVLAQTVDMKSFSMEMMWTRFSKVWINANVTDKLIECLDVPKYFCSWLLLYCQEEMSKYNFNASVQVSFVASEARLKEQEKETVTYICGAVLSKLIKKAYDNLQKPRINENAELALKKRIEALNCCKSSHSTGVNTGKLIETLDRGGLVYPKASFADLFHRAEKLFQDSVSGGVKKINVAAIVSQFFSQEANGNYSIRTKSIFSSKNVPENMQKVILKDSIKIYVKLRANAHAKHLIENYKSTSRKQKKEKALRKKLKSVSKDKKL